MAMRIVTLPRDISIMAEISLGNTGWTRRRWLVQKRRLNALLDHEAEELVNAEKYERSGNRKEYRSGHYNRNFLCMKWISRKGLIS